MSKNTASNRYSGILLAAGLLTAGFVNAYAQIVWGGSVSFQTGNMFRLGFTLASEDYAAALNYFICILSFIAGAAVSEWIKGSAKKHPYTQICYLLEAAGLFLVSFLPAEWKKPVYYSLIAMMGMHVNLFGGWNKLSINVNASTGNLKTIGTLFTKTVSGREPVKSKLPVYTLLSFTFVLGSFIGGKMTFAANEKSIWVICVLLIVMAVMDGMQHRDSSPEGK